MRRIPALLAAMGMAVGMVAGTGTGAGAQSSPTGPIDFGPVCINTPDTSPFNDVSANSTEISQAVRCVAFAQIALGTGNGTTFSPTLSTLRGQMASFVARTADLIDDLEADGVSLRDLPPYDGRNAFVDVPAASVHVGPINRLADAGIVLGGTGGRPANQYAETTPVTRGQLASFLVRSYQYLTGQALPAGPNAFDDDNASVHQDAINRAANARLTFGLSAGTFGPDVPITRGQIAVFIARFLGLFEQLGLIDPIPGDSGVVDSAGQVGDIAFRPFETARLVDVDGVTETSAADNRTYTATGLDNDEIYRITLVEAANVTIANGEATFVEAAAPDRGLADAGTVGGAIVAVNGLRVSRVQSVGAVVPDDGTITVDVDAATASRLYPVIYTDQEGVNTRLNLDAVGGPTEPYGVGGLLVTLPPEAPGGPVRLDQPVVFVDPNANQFVTIDPSPVSGRQFLYEYDANDQFALLDPNVALGAQNPRTLTLEQFEFLLSVGDILASSSTYSQDVGGVSRFVLINANNGNPPPLIPPAPTNGPDLISADLEGLLLSDTLTLVFDEVLDPDLGPAGPGGVRISGMVLDLAGVPLLQEGIGVSATVSGQTLTVTLDNSLILNLIPLTPYEVTVDPGVVTDLDGIPNPIGRTNAD